MVFKGFSFDANKPIRFDFFEFCDMKGLYVEIPSLICPMHPMISRFFFGGPYMDSQVLRGLTLSTYFFGHVGKWLDKKANVNCKLFDIF